MKYPRIANYLVFSPKGRGQYTVRDCLNEEEYTFGSLIARFAGRLDGKTDPYRIIPGLERETVERMLFCLEEHGLLREGRVLTSSFATVLVTLLIPKWSPASRAFARVFNTLLKWLWLPVPAAGVLLFLRLLPDLNGGGILAGTLLGLALGIPLHELGHAFACIAGGGRVFEMGVMTQFLLPGAYVLLDMEEIKNRFHRAQVHAAGVEMNFLLAGIFLLLTCFGWQGTTFFSAAINNLVLAVFNLTLAQGLDGMGILSELLAADDLVEQARQLLGSKREKGRLRRRGAGGQAALWACRLISSLSLGLPLVIAANIVEVIACFL